jgi:hypothetical protein
MLSGAIVHDNVVQRNIEILSINNQPAGIYMVIVSNNGQIIRKL